MKQLLAKLGVFALIVVNLGAYYVFWPAASSHSPGADKSENVGKTMPPAAPASVAQPADPWKTAPAAPPANAGGPFVKPTMPTVTMTKDNEIVLPEVPVLVEAPAPRPLPESVKTESPKVVAQADDPTKEQLKRLMDTFNKKEPDARPVAMPAVPKAEVVGSPANAGGSLAQADPPIAPAVYAAPAKMVQADNSPWTLHWEIAEGRASLTARLNKRLEFRIVGDRVKMETPDGAVVAQGKVVFTGPNLKGSCEKLTIGLTGDSVTLEGKAELQIQQGSLSDLAIPMVDLKGEQFTLRLQQLTGNLKPAAPTSPPAPPAGVVPASVNPATPSPFTLPGSFPSLQKQGP